MSLVVRPAAPLRPVVVGNGRAPEVVVLDVRFIQQGLLVKAHVLVVFRRDVVRAFERVAQRAVFAVEARERVGAMLLEVVQEHLAEVVGRHEEVADTVVVLSEEPLVQQPREVAARAGIRHVVAMHVDAVGELGVAVEDGLEQHFLLAEVHALVGIDDVASYGR